MTLAEKEALANVDAHTRKLYKQSQSKRGRKSAEEIAAIEAVTGLPYVAKYAKKTAPGKKWGAPREISGGAPDYNAFLRDNNIEAPELGETMKSIHQSYMARKEEAHAAVEALFGGKA